MTINGTEGPMDIAAIGEMLVDMTQTGTDENGTAVFSACPGGAPANVAVAAARPHDEITRSA